VQFGFEDIDSYKTVGIIAFKVRSCLLWRSLLQQRSSRLKQTALNLIIPGMICAFSF